MKKIVASVGLVALGASGFNAVYGQEMAPAPYKPWSVSASLRGFYDDNISTLPSSSGLKKGSFGYQLSPKLGLNWQNDQSTVDANYAYTLRWYNQKPYNNTSHYDQSHNFSIDAAHAFSERYRAAVMDSFVIGQEPDLLRYGYTLEEPQRVPGDNIRNYGGLKLDAQLTPLFGVEVGYHNLYVNYHDKTPYYVNDVPSLGAELNRIDNTFNLDGRWQVLPQTVGVLGYQYSQSDYTGNDHIASLGPSPDFGPFVNSDSRNYRANYGYVGADHNFERDLSGSLRAGFRVTDYYNSPSKENDVSPYVMATVRYDYTVDSYATLGFTYDRNATDIIAPANGHLTLAAESAVLYGTINHRLLSKLYGSLRAQFQNSTFSGGQYDGDSEQYYLLGLNLQYRFNRNLSAETGYNYDKVDSPNIGYRSYDRNRVYIGVTASY